jgi:hypothetical protein
MNPADITVANILENMPKHFLIPGDLELCRNVVLDLKKMDKNGLFLNPFDLAETPGYMDVVTKVMDLSTLSKNLEEGQYSQ